MSLCMSKFVENNINLDEGVKKNIIKNRKEQIEKMRLIKEIKKNMQNNEPANNPESTINQNDKNERQEKFNNMVALGKQDNKSE